MKPTTKQDRALAVLRLLGRGKDVSEIANILGRPESTIHKHMAAYRYLTGKEGLHRQETAFNALFYVRMGLSQREVARAHFMPLDHKFISDLCAMDWAVKTLMNNMNMDAIKALVERGLDAESRDRKAIREHVAELSEAFDDVLVALPTELTQKLEDAMTNLTEVIIEIESAVG
ncbi:resolvase [Vibrio fortis]|uniref:Resolvase n=1 Tax=Vibrio fortis TaxID=212667 RepID=A0A5N3QUW4_9VIBR|nr:helix-turn-helix domain-containing protein [Vibrio fortis]KAB0285441.1 resolvase [Vibrio fortis]